MKTKLWVVVKRKLWMGAKCVGFILGFCFLTIASLPFYNWLWLLVLAIVLSGLGFL